MNVNLPLDLHLQVHKIRNIEVWRSDLLLLILGRQKIPSTPINAFGVQLQDLDQGNQGYTIFSSRLLILLLTSEYRPPEAPSYVWKTSKIGPQIPYNWRLKSPIPDRDGMHVSDPRDRYSKKEILRYAGNQEVACLRNSDTQQMYLHYET